MDREEIVAKLRGLRLAAEVESEADVACIEVSLALVLWDVCAALELSDTDRAKVLGHRAEGYVRGFLDARVWPSKDPVVAVA